MEPHISPPSPEGARIRARSPSLRGTIEPTDRRHKHRNDRRRRRRPTRYKTKQRMGREMIGEEVGLRYTCFASGDGGRAESARREGGLWLGPVRRRSSRLPRESICWGWTGGVVEGERQWGPPVCIIIPFTFSYIKCRDPPLLTHQPLDGLKDGRDGSRRPKRRKEFV